MEKRILFATTGRTDVKLLALDSQQRQIMLEFDRDDTQALHQWLWDHPAGYTVQHQEQPEAPLYQKADGNPRIRIKIDDGKLLILPNKWATGHSGHPPGNSFTLATDPQGRCQLVPAKLGRLIADLQDQQQQGQATIIAAVVFNTHRDPDSSYAKEEPFANGKILARWLADCFGLNYAENQTPALNQAVWVDLLIGKEDQETTDQAINPAAINRLTQTLQVFAQDPDLQTAKAVLCGIGGIPRFKTLIRDSACFYFPGRCQLSEDSEQHQDTQGKPHVTDIGTDHLTAEQSFNLRAHVIQLIQSGDFIGAEAAIRFVNDDLHNPWVQPIRLVANWLRGMAVPLDTIADPELHGLLRQAQEAKASCLLPGLRAEAALQGGRYVEAIGATAAFIDAALSDSANCCLKKFGKVKTYHDSQGEVRCKHPPQLPLDVDVTNPKSALYIKCTMPLTYVYTIMGPQALKDWAKIIALVIALPELETLINRINGSEKGPRPYKYRNTNTHSVLSPSDLEKAKEVFYAACLWQEAPLNASGHLHFLSDPNVIAVAARDGIANIGQFYLNLVRLLIARLNGFRWPE